MTGVLPRAPQEGLAGPSAPCSAARTPVERSAGGFSGPSAARAGLSLWDEWQPVGEARGQLSVCTWVSVPSFLPQSSLLGSVWSGWSVPTLQCSHAHGIRLPPRGPFLSTTPLPLPTPAGRALGREWRTVCFCPCRLHRLSLPSTGAHAPCCLAPWWPEGQGLWGEQPGKGPCSGQELDGGEGGAGALRVEQKERRRPPPRGWWGVTEEPQAGPATAGLETVDGVGLGDRTLRRAPCPSRRREACLATPGRTGGWGPACWGSAGTCCLGQPRCSRERARGQGGPQDARRCPPGKADERMAGAWGLRQPPCHGPRPGCSDHVLSSPRRPQAQVQSQVRGPTAGLPDELLGGGPRARLGPAPGKPKLRALPGPRHGLSGPRTAEARTPTGTGPGPMAPPWPACTPLPSAF